MTALTVFTPYGMTTISPKFVDISATKRQLWDWANRPDNAWPASVLARCRYVEAQFDGHGLLDLMIDPLDDPDDLVLGDEFNAWASDVFAIIRSQIPADHPCHDVRFHHYSEEKP